jgi:hypothetical protein
MIRMISSTVPRPMYIHSLLSVASFFPRAQADKPPEDGTMRKIPAASSVSKTCARRFCFGF